MHLVCLEVVTIELETLLILWVGGGGLPAARTLCGIASGALSCVGRR